MHHQRIGGGEFAQHMPGASSRIEIVFRENLEPVDRGPLLQQVLVMDGAQPHPETERTRGEPVHYDPCSVGGCFGTGFFLAGAAPNSFPARCIWASKCFRASVQA